jgi:hypothetical protein
MKASERAALRARREAEWQASIRRLAIYTPLPAERAEPPNPRVAFWSFANRAVIMPPPEFAKTLGSWAATWYAARRDADLLQVCPICDGVAIVADTAGVIDAPERVVASALVHEPRCPVGDEMARRLRSTPFPGATA